MTEVWFETLLSARGCACVRVQMISRVHSHHVEHELPPRAKITALDPISIVSRFRIASL